MIDFDDFNWFLVDLIVGFLYLLDVLINCLLAYYDSDMNLVTSKRNIIVNYAKGWLFFDVLASLPYQMMFESSSNFASIAKMGRLPRLYRLIKMGKIIRMCKLIKTRSRMMRYMNSVLRVDVAVERLIWFFLTYLILIHLLSCL